MRRVSGFLFVAAMLGLAPGVACAHDRAARQVETFIALCEATAAEPQAAIAAAESRGWSGSTADPAPAALEAGADRFRETNSGDLPLSLMVSLVSHAGPDGPIRMNDCSLAAASGDKAALQARFEAVTGLTPTPGVSPPNAVGYFYLIEGDQRTPVPAGLSRADYLRAVTSSRFRMVFIGGEGAVIISVSTPLPQPNDGAARP